MLILSHNFLHLGQVHSSNVLQLYRIMLCNLASPQQHVFVKMCHIFFTLHFGGFRINAIIRFENVPLYIWMDIRESLMSQCVRMIVVFIYGRGKLDRWNILVCSVFWWQCNEKKLRFLWYFNKYCEYRKKIFQMSSTLYFALNLLISIF